MKYQKSSLLELRLKVMLAIVIRRKNWSKNREQLVLNQHVSLFTKFPQINIFKDSSPQIRMTNFLILQTETLHFQTRL